MGGAEGRKKFWRICRDEARAREATTATRAEVRFPTATTMVSRSSSLDVDTTAWGGAPAIEEPEEEITASMVVEKEKVVKSVLPRPSREPTTLTQL